MTQHFPFVSIFASQLLPDSKLHGIVLRNNQALGEQDNSFSSTNWDRIQQE
jgi:hypothetical protein